MSFGSINSSPFDGLTAVVCVYPQASKGSSSARTTTSSKDVVLNKKLDNNVRMI